MSIHHMAGKSRLRRRRRLVQIYGPYCMKCGVRCETPTLDHIVPPNLGGSNALENLQLLCWDCNQDKGFSIADYRPFIYDFDWDRIVSVRSTL